MYKKIIVMIVAVAFLGTTLPVQVMLAEEISTETEIVSEVTTDVETSNGSGSSEEEAIVRPAFRPEARLAFIPLVVTTGKITVNLQVVNNNGGTKVVADFPLTVATGTVSTAVAAGIQTDFQYDTYTVAIGNTTGYTVTAFGGDCTSAGVVTVSANDPQRTCNIVVDDNIVVVPPTKPVVTASCFTRVSPVVAGDVNGDGNINSVDNTLLTATYNQASTSPTFNAHADFNNDGMVDFNDMVPLAQNFNTINIHYTALAEKGDINHDGAVDKADNDLLTATYNQASTSPSFNADADFNHDGMVDFIDMVVLAQNFNTSISECQPAPSNPNPQNPKTETDTFNYFSNGGGVGTTTLTTTATTTGQILGTSTEACAPFIKSFIKSGVENNTADVANLQKFLNTELSLNLNVNGQYDAPTLNAVNSFQLKYKSEVLAPWVPYGLPNDSTPTGYVYKTTSWKINSLSCPNSVVAFPQLP
jgi:hypothetical protein